MNGPDTLMAGLQQGWAVFMSFLPRLLLAAIILIVGYFLAKLIARGVDAVLDRVHFDRAVERGGIKRALDRTNLDASDIVARIVFYALMLFVLELTFSVFGPNPISLILTGIIAFLPNIFVALIIVVVAAAIASGVRQLLLVATANLSYGRVLSNLASAAILVLGIFAALDQLRIARNIVDGLFYATLVAIVGSAVIAIGGGGIVPMRRQWEKALNRLERELPRGREEAKQSSTGLAEEVHQDEPMHQETPRF